RGFARSEPRCSEESGCAVSVEGPDFHDSPKPADAIASGAGPECVAFAADRDFRDGGNGRSVQLRLGDSASGCGGRREEHVAADTAGNRGAILECADDGAQRAKSAGTRPARETGNVFRGRPFSGDPFAALRKYRRRIHAKRGRYGESVPEYVLRCWHRTGGD